MSNYNNLKTTIDANIKQNGNQEITGPILNSVLNQMVNILGAGYQFAGVATLDPATNPGTPDAKVFYIANGKGTYTNFGGLEVTEDEVVVLYWDSAWHKVATGIASQAKLSELEERVSIIEINNEDVETKVGLTIGIKDPNIATLDNTTFLQGYLDVDGSFIPTTNTQKTSDFIEVESGKVYEIDATGHTGQSTVPLRFVGVYDSEKQLVRKLMIPSDLTFYVRDGEKYVRANINADVIDIFNLHIKDEVINTFIKDNVEYERLTIAENKLKTIWQGSYIHPRRATIAFIIDGFYEFNQNRIDIFEKHGIKVGIAPQYTIFRDSVITKTINDIRTCLGWQKKGHEILAHLNYILDEDTTIDDATAKGYIREAQREMTKRGVIVSGAIGSSGNVADRFIPTIKQCFSYAATLNNHEGTSVAIHEFGTSQPYKLWRYSLQTSTPEQQKAAVDAAIENNALLLFYGHAQSTTDYFSDENLEALLSYIDMKKNDFLCQVKTPFDAITDFFSIRYEDKLQG